VLPPKDLLQAKLQEAIASARRRLSSSAEDWAIFLRDRL
jgi:hypothetical protein